MHTALEKQFLSQINQHIRLVYRVCNVYCQHNPEEREDLFQEIMYQLWKAYPSFRGESAFSTWLYKVALNTAITYLKKTNRTPAQVKLASQYHQIAENTDHQHQEEKLNLLYAAIHTLTDVDKAITLLYLEESSYEEIAAITGLTKSNVSVRLVRIKERWKKNSNEQFIKRTDMESLDAMKRLWQASEAPQTNPDLLTQAFMEKIIKPRIRKEQSTVMQYFWASFVYQILIYAFASHLIIRFWGDSQIMLLSLAGVLLYIPFTIVLMQKFKAVARLPIHQPGVLVQDVYRNVQTKHALLTQFYRFKRRFDWLAVPLSCLLIVVILFKLYVDGGIENHPTGGIITYLLILSLFVMVTYAENRKRFKIPLRQLKLIMQDLKG